MAVELFVWIAWIVGTTLAVGVVLALVYVGLGIGLTPRLPKEFAGGLRDRLSVVLNARGFNLSLRVPAGPVVGVHIATFEGPSFMLDVMWDAHDRVISLHRRSWKEPDLSAGQRLAQVHVQVGAPPLAYAEAAEAIVSAARAISGAA